MKFTLKNVSCGWIAMNIMKVLRNQEGLLLQGVLNVNDGALR